MYPNLDAREIKGSDLLIRNNNHILDEFIKDFVNGDNLLITFYDKKFFVVTNLLVWLFGEKFRDEQTIVFHKFAEFLIKLDDKFLGNFIYTLNNNYINNIEMFIKYLVDYNFDECITTPFEISIKNELVECIKFFQSRGTEYFELLKDSVIAEGIKIKGKYRNNIVNLTALGETILLYKVNTKFKNENIKIYHDKIGTIEEYLGHYSKTFNLDFIESKDNIQIQLADNVSSVVGKFINSILPMLSDKSVKEALKNENKWVRERLSLIMRNVNKNNIKMVVSLREQAFIKTYSLTSISNFSIFKEEVIKNIDIRFINELYNYMSIEQSWDTLIK